MLLQLLNVSSLDHPSSVIKPISHYVPSPTMAMEHSRRTEKLRTKELFLTSSPHRDQEGREHVVSEEKPRLQVAL